MTLAVRVQLRLALVCLITAPLLVIAEPARVQAQNWGGPWTNLTAGGILPLPPPPPQGEFYQVIFANDQWVVVQNRLGQQFPVAASYIGQMLVRWQADLGDLSPMVLVEAIGPAVLGGMTIQTDHIDLFIGTDQVLVKPGYVSVLPINRPVTAIDPTYQRYMSGYDIAAQNTLYAWVYPTYPGDNSIPGQMHVVGNPRSIAPLSLGVPGNNVVGVLPPNPGVMTVTRVTMGGVQFARKGDAAFLTPVQGSAVTDKSLRIAQAVLYKNIRREQFVP
jgi:hypothetical protein